MPLAVTHVLIPIIAVDLFRDHVLKNTRMLTIKYVFLAGLGGLSLDLDLPLADFLKYYLGFSIESHRIFFHNIWIPLAFLAAAFIFFTINRKRIFKVSLMLSIGMFFHLMLDGFLNGEIFPFYPLSGYMFGLNLIPYIPDFFAGLDAVMLILWLYHEELTHKISDFF